MSEHIICDKCGKVWDGEFPVYDEVLISHQNIRTGVTIRSHLNLCRQCGLSFVEWLGVKK